MDRLVFGYYVYLLLVWGIFRLTIRFDEVIEELWFKPILWLLPVLIMWMRDRKRVKFFEGKIIKGLMWGLGVGSFYAVIVWGLSRWGMDLREVEVGKVWDYVGVGLVTAVTEELVFAGFVFQKLKRGPMKVESAMIVSALMFGLIHLPISIFIYEYTWVGVVGFVWLMSLLQMINNWLMERTNNVVVPILSHWIWGMVVLLWL